MVELAIATKSDTLGGLRLCIDELLQSRALLTGFTRRVYDQEGIIIHHDWSVVVCYFLLLTATDREPFRAHARMGGLRESVVGIAREVALG